MTERRRNIKEAPRLPSNMFLTLMLLLVSVGVSQSSVDYTGWKVVEVTLEGGNDAPQTLQKLHHLEAPSYLVVLDTHRDKVVAEIAVSPEALEYLEELQRSNEISFTTTVEDLGKLILTETPVLRADPLPTGDATFDRFMSLDEIYAHLEDLPNRYPDNVRLTEIGRSYEDRPIYKVKVTHSRRVKIAKPIIYIDGGIHAREWISPSSTLNIIGNLLESPSLIRSFDWHIVPILNPDGYHYSWTQDRLWRKNRGYASNSCVGVDLNRNFGYEWGGPGTSSYPCSSIFKGPSAFSEPESKALRDDMSKRSNRIKAYVTIHSYGQYILYPWGYADNIDHPNVDQLDSIGRGMANVILANDGTEFSVGSAAKLLYEAAGASDDWAAGGLDIPLVYTLELRDTGAWGFVLPEHLIVPAVKDAWLSIKYMARQIAQNDGTKKKGNKGTRPTVAKLRPEPVPRASPLVAPGERPSQLLIETEPMQRLVEQPANVDPLIRQPFRQMQQRFSYHSSEEDSSSLESSEESYEDKK